MESKSEAMPIEFVRKFILNAERNNIFEEYYTNDPVIPISQSKGGVFGNGAIIDDSETVNIYYYDWVNSSQPLRYGLVE